MPRALRLATLAALCVTLAACSNRSEEEVSATSVVKGVFSSVFNRQSPTAPDPNVVAQQAAQVLASTSGQVIVVAIPERDVLSVMQEIERNGAYVTFGTSDRRSVTLKNGIITATRGLGHDLMSADVDAVGALIRGRETGAARRVNRYLDGENMTVALAPWCQVKPGGGGEAGTATMLESCTADARTFQNAYQVNGAGGIVQSRQWISPLHGYMVVRSLR